MLQTQNLCAYVRMPQTLNLRAARPASGCCRFVTTPSQPHPGPPETDAEQNRLSGTHTTISEL